MSYAPIVSSVIRESSSLVYTFLRYNNLYGSHHLKFYSNYNFDILFFVRSVRLYYGFNFPFDNFIRVWYVLSPLSSASSSSLSFFCGCIRVYQWSVQEPLSPRLATVYSPVDHRCSLSVLFLFSLAPNFCVFNNNNNYSVRRGTEQARTSQEWLFSFLPTLTTLVQKYEVPN